MSLIDPPGDRTTAEVLLDRLREGFAQVGAVVERYSDGDDPQSLVDRDSDLMNLAAAGNGGRTLLRVWQNQRAPVVPRAFRARPGFALACRRSSVPVLCRRSGGTAVFHGTHVLNISLALPPQPTDAFSIALCYSLLGDQVIPVLRELNTSVRLGDVPGAHCPGRFSLVCRDRKLAGTAAFTQCINGRQAAVVHASLSVCHDERDLAQIHAFEHAIGLNRRYNQSSHISLAEAIGTSRSCKPSHTGPAISAREVTCNA